MRSLLSVVGAVVLGLVVATGAYADGAKETVKGTVSVVKADDGTTSVTVVSDDGTPYAVAGEKAKDVEALDGKAVEVTGKVTEADGKKTVTVELVKEVPAE